jgi:hypothetical protein
MLGFLPVNQYLLSNSKVTGLKVLEVGSGTKNRSPLSSLIKTNNEQAETFHTHVRWRCIVFTDYTMSEDIIKIKVDSTFCKIRDRNISG